MPVILILRARKIWYPGAFCWLNRVEYTDISKIFTEYERRLRKIKFLNRFFQVSGYYLRRVCFGAASGSERRASEAVPKPHRRNPV